MPQRRKAGKPRSKSVRRPAARRRPAPRARRTFRGARLVLVVLGGALLIGVLSGAAGRVGSTVVDAIAASRRAEMHREIVAGFASEYGIPYELARAIDEAAAEEGLDPALAFRLVRVESEFRQRAVSSVGAIGYTQLMPATAAWLQPGITPEEIFDRDTNLRLGFRYLRWLLEVYDGEIDEALHAYNRGPGTVDRIRAEGKDPANGFADRVLGRNRPEPYVGTGLLPGGSTLHVHP